MKRWTFVAVADMQPGSPKSYRYRAALTENWQTAMKQIKEIAPDLVLVPGDLTRDGSVHAYELEQAKIDLESLGCSWHVVPGNMDTGNKHTSWEGFARVNKNQMRDIEINVTSEQLRHFSSVYGPLQWSFVHKDVRFSGFPDVAIGSGLPEEKAFWEWAEELIKQPREKHHVWIMHYALFVDRPDEPNWDITDPDQYNSWYFNIDEPHRSRLLDLFKATGTDIVISGHIHCRKVHMVDGIRFDLAPSTAFSQWEDHWPDGDPTLGFLRYDVDDNGIQCNFVPLEKISEDTRSYGPGGHPGMDVRDYSLAWEKDE